jgi:3-oxoacyl-[acyl-carrier-protein] synthase-3
MAIFPSAYGMAMGSRIVDNQVELEGMEPTRRDILLKRLGVMKRFVGSIDEDVSCLALRAMGQLPFGTFDDCDMLVAVTQTSPNKLPHMASKLQHAYLPGRRCASFDLNLGCSGFVYAYILISTLRKAGLVFNPVLVCGDTYNRYIRDNRNPASLLFSDSAVCMTFSADDGGTELLGVDMGGDGSGADSLCLTESNGIVPSSLYMDGAAVLQFTLSVVPDSVFRVLDKARLKIDDIDLFVFHQASAIVLEEISRKLKIPPEKFPSNLATYGNTVSCSIPLLLKGLAETGKISAGMKILMCGFGVGLSWASCIVKI